MIILEDILYGYVVALRVLYSSTYTVVHIY